MNNALQMVEHDACYFHERTEFIEAGYRPYRKLIDEADWLIRWHREKGVNYSAVSLHKLKNVRVWTDYQAICVYTEDNEIIESLSLIDDSFDFSSIHEIPIEPMPGTMALIPHLDPYNYYHWLIDTLAFPGVLEMAGHSLDSIDHFYIHRMENNFQREHLAALGVEDAKIRFLDNGRKQHYLLEELLVPLFRMDQGYWPAPWSMNYLKQTYLPKEVAEGLSERAPTGNCIYVVRGDARRAIRNENELIDRLKQENYIIVKPHQMSLQEQALAFSQADFVLGSHGAGLANIAFCKPNTKLMEFGGHYITTHFRLLSALNDLNYEAIGAGVDDEQQPLTLSFDGSVRDADFTVDVERVVALANDYLNDKTVG